MPRCEINKQTSKYHDYLIEITLFVYSKVLTLTGVICVFSAHKKISDTCLAVRNLWERLATKPCTGWLWKLTGSEQNDPFDPRPVLAFRYCRCLHLSVCPSMQAPSRAGFCTGNWSSLSLPVQTCIMLWVCSYWETSVRAWNNHARWGF